MIALLGFAFLQAAVMEPQCRTMPGPMVEIEALLDTRFGEHMEAEKYLDGDVVLHLYVNDQTGTWTILRSFADETACVVGAGDGWHRNGKAT